MHILMQILSIALVEAEATEAALKHSNVNDCCPYPFDTAAGRVYRLAFEAAIARAEEPININTALDIALSLDQFEAVEGAAA